MKAYFLCRRDDVREPAGRDTLRKFAEFDDGTVVVRWIASMNAVGVPSTDGV
jgi:hypothetical protein